MSSIQITPFNEANDVMYMTLVDQPDGCQHPLLTPSWAPCHLWTPKRMPAPVPSSCSNVSGRPDGCPCDHSEQCMSDWCTGKCSKHPMARLRGRGDVEEVQ